jgi:FkbM family methyltransferase
VKIIYIVPHLSTGGMPEYLKNKIEKLKDDSDVWILEKSKESTYNTIRLRIERLIGSDRIITWGENPNSMCLDIIDSVNPDIVHFEEPCEQFLSDFMLNHIFRKDRSYKILETFHDSSVRIEEKRFLPDKFLVVSPWQVHLLRELGVPTEVIEHELSNDNLPDREHCRKNLGFDPSKKHVVQIGIFTPRKNQVETVELARMLPDIQFHLVGTLADNYSWYWNQILNNLPSNCKIWGERDDVNSFYSASDLVIFPSIALFNDKETSPLVIRETINMGAKLLLRNLPVYVDMYQESDRVFFMENGNVNNAKLIKNILGMENKINESNLLEVSFEASDNKINYRYLGESPGNVWLSIKDIDSNACIYAFDVNIGGPWQSFWCIPIPKEYYDFDGNKDFTGFRIELYKEKNSESPFVYNDIILGKSINKKRLPSNPYINFDPVFVNYSQFFVDGIYNQFFAGYRVNSAIDIGANVGLFTEWVLDRFGSDTKVIAVEPNSSAINAFKNLHKGKENVMLAEYAMSDKSGEIIKMLVNPDNSLISSIEGTGNGYTEHQDVETINLFDLMDSYGLSEVDLLKVDIEGAEYQMFSSVSGEEIRKRFKHLLIEFHNNNGRARDLIQKIQMAGFEVDLRDDDTRYSVDENNDRGTIFATRID